MTKLREGVFDTDLQSINFFNRRLLSGEDMQREQSSIRQRDVRLGRAVGEGIAYGLEVTRKTGDTAPNVIVTPGVAVNRRGRTLSLATETELALVPATDSATPGTGTFSECTGVATSVYTGSVVGLHLLVITPATGSDGLAPVSGLGNQIVECNTGYQTEGVQFRLIPLNSGFTQTELANVSLLRNLAAYRCFGESDIASNPFAETSASYGLLDTLRPSTLTDCDVPLAVLHWPVVNQLGFIDMWSVRRRAKRSLLVPYQIAADAVPPQDDRWAPYTGDRRWSEAEARFQQFQAHIRSIRDEGTSVTQGLRAKDRFLYLPPSGYLPVSGDKLFSYEIFLGDLNRRPARKANRGVLRRLLTETWGMDAIDLTGNPAVPVDVWESSDSSNFVLFTRSMLGRVVVSLPPSAGSATLTLTAADGGWKTTHSGSTASADVYAGDYSATVQVAGFSDYTASVTAIAGETVVMQPQLTPLPGGRVNVTVRTGTRNLAGLITAVRLVRTGNTAYLPTTLSGQTYAADSLTPGTYTISVDGGESFTSAEQTGVAVASGSTQSIDIELSPRKTAVTEPGRRVTVERIKELNLEKADLMLVVERAEFQGKTLFGKLGVLEFEESGFIGGMTAGSSTFRDEPSQYLPNYPSYSRALQREIGPAAVNMVPVTLPANGRNWLRQWRDYIAGQAGSKAATKQEPILYADRKYSKVTGAKAVANWQALAEFGKVTIPVIIIPADHTIPGKVDINDKYLPGIGPEVSNALKDYGILSLDELRYTPEPFLIDILNDPPRDYLQSIIEDADRAVEEVNANFGYLQGVSTEVASKMRGAGITDLEHLATADPATLGGVVGQGLAVRLITQAKKITNG